MARDGGTEAFWVRDNEEELQELGALGDQTELAGGWGSSRRNPQDQGSNPTQPLPASLPPSQLAVYSLVMLLVLLLGDTRLLSSMATCRLPEGLPL